MLENTNEETITISTKLYKRLESDSFKLHCLENGGVDNWTWYGESLKPWRRKYFPEKKILDV